MVTRKVPDEVPPMVRIPFFQEACIVGLMYFGFGSRRREAVCRGMFAGGSQGKSFDKRGIIPLNRQVDSQADFHSFMKRLLPLFTFCTWAWVFTARADTSVVFNE